MSNSIKYSTTGDTLSLKKGNLFFGTGDVGKGPSSVSQHFNGVTPNSGSYTVYFYDPGQPNNIGYDPISSDVHLIRYTNGMFGQNFTTAQQCLNWYSSQTNYTCVNKDYEEIVTSGLTLNLDAGFLPSYGGSGTTWYDLSYSGYNINLTNGPTYSSDGGGSILFDGVDDMAIGSTITTYTNTQTWTAWVKRTSSVNLFNMFMGRFLPYFAFRSDGLFHFSNQIGGTQRNLYSLQTYSNNVWYFTSFTTEYQNPNTIMKMYINGSLVNSSEFSGTQNNYSINFTVGDGRNTSTWYPFNGYVSMVSVYNRTLSSDEILKNYNAGLARFNTANIVKSNLVLNLDSSNSVSYPTTGTTWTDLSGNGNHGTLVNGPTFDSTSKSIDFDGTNDYATINSVRNQIVGTTPFTINMLIKFNSFLDAFNCFFGVNTSSGANRLLLGVDTVGAINVVKNGVDEYSPSLLSLNQWYNISLSNSSSGVPNLYVNGVLVPSIDAISTIPFANNDTWTIGAEYDNTSLSDYIDSNITQVSIYNKALSQSEILQNYYQSPIVTDGLRMSLDAGNLVSYSGAGTTWKDLTAYGYNGTLTNGPTFSGVSGGAIVFDGTDDIVTGGLNGSIFTGDFTQTAWIYKLNNNQPWQGVFTNSSPATNNTYLMTFGNGSVDAPYNSIGVNRVGVSASGVFLDIGSHLNRWLYVAISKVGSTLNIYCFKDGNLLSTTGTITWNGGNFATTNNYQIGRHWAGTSVVPFQGLMSNVSLYDRALSTDEIAQNYNATKSRFGL
jgi:hypothetical protein